MLVVPPRPPLPSVNTTNLILYELAGVGSFIQIATIDRSIDRLCRGSPWFFFQIGNLCGRQDADVTATAHVLYTSVRTRRGRVLLFALQSLIVSACWQDLIALFNHYVWIFSCCIVKTSLSAVHLLCPRLDFKLLVLPVRIIRAQKP